MKHTKKGANAHEDKPSKSSILFDDEKSGEVDGFKINEQFAKKFEYNQRRQLLEKGQQKYGDLDSGSESDEVEEEDDDGELINTRVEEKFLETIALIRENDPKIKQVTEDLFKDEDFESDGEAKNKIGKKLTYKDQIRENVLAGNIESSDDENEGQFMKKKAKSGETIYEEAQRLKKEFKKAANEESDGEGFVMKKVAGQVSDEEDTPENLEGASANVIVQRAQQKAKKEMNFVTDTDLLRRFYGDEKTLDKTDKFLRNYILLQCWKDKNGANVTKVQENIDNEDQARDEEMDAFEHMYNFRFEEGTGAYITTHQRTIEDSMRRKDDGRKDKRQEKKER